MKKLNILLFGLFILTTVLLSQSKEPWPWKSHDADLSLLIFGDTNIQNREYPVDAFRYILPTMQAADLRICNMEGPMSGTSTDPLQLDIPHKSQWKHSDPKMISGFTEAHIDLVSVANNVTWPWTALMKSLKVLDENGIKHAGGGKNFDQAHEPVIIKKNGTTIGFLAYACTVFPFQHAATDDTPGIATVRVDTYYKPPRNLDKPGMPPSVVTIPVAEELERMRTDISQLAPKVDIVVVSFHWGISHHWELIDYQVDIAHAAVEAGADIIMGHGNHEVCPVEVYKSKPIFYGLGQVVFDWPQMVTRKDGLLTKIDVSKNKIENVSILPSRRDDDNYAHFLDPNSGKGNELYHMLKERSAELAQMHISGKEIVLELD